MRGWSIFGLELLRFFVISTGIIKKDFMMYCYVTDLRDMHVYYNIAIIAKVWFLTTIGIFNNHMKTFLEQHLQTELNQIIVLSKKFCLLQTYLLFLPLQTKNNNNTFYPTNSLNFSVDYCSLQGCLRIVAFCCFRSCENVLFKNSSHWKTLRYDGFQSVYGIMKF